jgi:hypothetical protein
MSGYCGADDCRCEPLRQFFWAAPIGTRASPRKLGFGRAGRKPGSGRLLPLNVLAAGDLLLPHECKVAIRRSARSDSVGWSGTRKLARYRSTFPGRAAFIDVSTSAGSGATRTKLTQHCARLAEWSGKVGRVQEYAAEHVVRLERSKRLQADGRTLLEIGRILSGPSAATPLWNRRRDGGSMRSAKTSSCG